MLNSPPLQHRDEETEHREVAAAVRAGPSGALTLAAIATAIVVACWFAFYLFVFLPRGSLPGTPMTTLDHVDEGARVAERVERRWAILSIAIIVLLAGLAAFAGIHQATMPQARVETIKPQTLHLDGEFIESNLGSAVELDGSVTVRAVGQQYSFTPQCMVVPTDTPVVFRATSPDVVHGFLIQNTNVNTMLVPGYVSEIPAKFRKPGEYLMPCQEYCGVGHEGMWAKVKVVDKPEFLSMSSNSRRVTCVE